jgi:hypothetical protein
LFVASIAASAACVAIRILPAVQIASSLPVRIGSKFNMRGVVGGAVAQESDKRRPALDKK